MPLSSCPEDIDHLLSVWPKYTSERNDLEVALLRLDTRPSSVRILGLWADNWNQNGAIKAVLISLANTLCILSSSSRNSRLRNKFYFDFSSLYER